jgi:DNA ligase 1
VVAIDLRCGGTTLSGTRSCCRCATCGGAGLNEASMKRSLTGMVKRSLSTTPSTPKQKRSKISVDQPSLEAFFSSSSLSRKSPSKQTHKVGSLLQDHDGGKATELDAEYAERLAREDGIDVDLTRKLETGWLQSQRQLGPVSIDVDLIDELGQAGPSKLALQKEPSPSTSTLFHPLAPGSQSSRGKLVSKTFSPMRSREDISVVTSYKPLMQDSQTFAIDERPWPPNSGAPYSFLAHLLATLAGTRSRIIIINALTNALRVITRHDPLSLLPALYLLSNTLSPPYLPIELGLGPTIISKSIQHVSGITPQALRRFYKTSGDVGDVAFEAKSNLRTLVPHPPLSITAVYESLLKIANTKGQGAAKQKQAIVERLLVAAKGEEIRFLTRTLSQNLRVGAVRTSILTALARAMVLTPPLNTPVAIPSTSIYHASPELVSEVKQLVDTKKKDVDSARDAIDTKFIQAESLIKKVFVTHPNYNDIVAALLDAGLDGLSERTPLTVGKWSDTKAVGPADIMHLLGIPLHPTLGSPTRSLDEIYERLGELPFTAEFKYDGQRAQIHGSRTADGKISVHVFSRHLEDMTSKVISV